jgi:hypothetical protein
MTCRLPTADCRLPTDRNTKLVGIGNLRRDRTAIFNSTDIPWIRAHFLPWRRSITPAESIAKMSFPTFKDLDKEASGKDQNRCVAQEILWAKI